MLVQTETPHLPPIHHTNISREILNRETKFNAMNLLTMACREGVYKYIARFTGRRGDEWKRDGQKIVGNRLKLLFFFFFYRNQRSWIEDFFFKNLNSLFRIRGELALAINQFVFGIDARSRLLFALLTILRSRFNRVERVITTLSFIGKFFFFSITLF